MLWQRPACIEGGDMSLPTQSYEEQSRRWPADGQHILAHHDENSVVVYQAYRPAIGQFAIAHGYLGGPDFSFNRMSWIKPNFLWMMYRSGWGTKEGQEIILGLRLRRAFFEALLAQAVRSSYDAQVFPSEAAWKAAAADSDVRLQWDPDHAPDGSKLARRAIQLGLRGEALRQMAGPALLEVIDMTSFVASQRPHVFADQAQLQTPVEEVFSPGG